MNDSDIDYDSLPIRSLPTYKLMTRDGVHRKQVVLGSQTWQTWHPVPGCPPNVGAYWESGRTDTPHMTPQLREFCSALADYFPEYQFILDNTTMVVETLDRNHEPVSVCVAIVAYVVHPGYPYAIGRISGQRNGYSVSNGVESEVLTGPRRVSAPFSLAKVFTNNPQADESLMYAVHRAKEVLKPGDIYTLAQQGQLSYRFTPGRSTFALVDATGPEPILRTLPARHGVVSWMEPNRPITPKNYALPDVPTPLAERIAVLQLSEDARILGIGARIDTDIFFIEEDGT